MEEITYPLIYAKIPAIMQDIEAVGKNKKNTGQNYMFRGIDDMYNALHDVLAKHQVFYTSKVLEKNVGSFKSAKGSDVVHALMDMEITFFAIDGSHVSNVVVGEAMDFGDKACGKAQSYGLKVALMQIFCIPTEEKLDTEYENHQVAGTTKKISQNKPAQNTQAAKQGNVKQEAPKATPKPATPEQKAEIVKLLQHELITAEESDQMTAKLDLISYEKAIQVMANMNQKIKERQAAKEVAHAS